MFCHRLIYVICHVSFLKCDSPFFFIGQYNPVGPKDSQSLTLCLNSTKIVETLEDVMSKARTMYDAGAYLHWFWKHGCSKVKAVKIDSKWFPATAMTFIVFI